MHISNLGKTFENNFKDNWKKCFPQSFIYRLSDQMSGYRYTSSNICDFICFNNKILFLIELKSHKGASLPFVNITQYEKLKGKVGIPGVRAGIILWLYEKDIVMYIPISTITQMKSDGKKSVGLKAIEEGYNIKIIPSQKKRVFMDSDYSCLCDLKDGE